MQESHYEIGDFVYHLNSASKTGESKKLKPVWIGPLVVIDVINLVLFWVKDHKKEYVLHHDCLKRCEDRSIPFWLRKLRHNLLDLDTTIAYDEAELDAMQKNVPPLAASLASSEGEMQEKATGDEPPDEFSLSSTPVDQDSSLLTPEFSDPIPKTPLPVLVHDHNCSTDPTIGPSHDSSSVEDEVPSPNLSLSDSQVKDTSDLLLVEDNLGLDSLFEEVIHVHAQKPQVSRQPKRGQARSPKKLSSQSLAESITRAGRQGKTPSYLKDYAC